MDVYQQREDDNKNDFEDFKYASTFFTGDEEMSGNIMYTFETFSNVKTLFFSSSDHK